MGDYLNHLMGRVSGVQAAVRPRLPSWFEPPRGLAATRLSYIFPPQRAEREETQRLEEFSSTIAAPIPRLPARQERSATVTPAIILRDPAHGPLKSDPQPLSAQPGTERPPIVYTKHVRESVRHDAKEDREERDDVNKQQLRSAAQSMQPRNMEEAELFPPRTGIKKPIVRRPDKDSDTAQRDTLVPAPQRRRMETARETIPALEQRTTETPLAQAAPVRPAESMQNVRNLSSVRAFRQAPVVVRTEPLEDSAPSVQVVIGRVIVQAIAPPPPPVPQAPRAQAPRLSLEEYLRQREGRP